MENYLLQHALNNVWCTPDQDNQLIFKLARLTPFDGVINKYQYHWDYIPLPEANTRFHIYHIGQISPALLNLLDTRDELDRLIWKSFKDTCNTKLATVNLYVKYGIELPRFCSYYLVTPSNDVIIAIKRYEFFDFNNDDVYFRTYLNSYFSSIRQVTGLDYVKTNGKFISNNNDILSIQSEVTLLKSEPGFVTCFVNGYKQSSITLTNSKIGDYVEYFYDSSIKKIVTLTVSSLKTFDSILDTKGKYLLHYPGKTSIIDYQDDIDIYLIQKSTGKGVYIHKNAKDTLRNITHKDYSLVTSYVNDDFYHFKDNNGVIDTTDLAIEMHIRKSGYDRNLVYEVNRINELYKLSDANLVNALVGVQSSLTVWKAATLEQSAYVNLMRSKYSEVNMSKVIDTYGYDSIAYTFGNNIKEVYLSGSVRKADVPLLYQNGCTVFEYDIDGLLINFFTFNGGQTYICQTTSNYVEFISGVGGVYLDEYVDSVDVSLDKEYKVYLKKDSEWLDVTATDYYNIINGVITWNSQLVNSSDNKLIRTLDKFICYRKNVSFNNGYLNIPIIYKQKINNVYSDMVMQVPMGRVEVFLNGHSLIENLDFYYKDFSIIITNKEYIIGNGVQDVVVRLTGFCNNDLTTIKTSDMGFIQRGMLSDDHQFDIREGIVSKLVIDGKLVLPSVVDFYEDGEINSTYNTVNGKPYQLTNTFIPVKSLTGVDSDDIFDKENITDKQISEYMTLRLNQISAPNLSVNTSKHYLYSPFLSNIINDLVDGTIDTTAIPDRLDTSDIINICSNYEHMLITDPIYVDNVISRDYVIIHPHPYSNVINLNLKQYKVLEAVVNIYAKGIVELVNQVKLI